MRLDDRMTKRINLKTFQNPQCVKRLTAFQYIDIMSMRFNDLITKMNVDEWSDTKNRINKSMDYTKFKLNKKKLFSFESMKKLLDNINTPNPIIKENQSIIIKNALLFIIYNLNGSFINLIKILHYLINNKYLTDDFRLIYNINIIIAGDVFANNVYKIEIIGILFKLKLNNPDKVHIIGNFNNKNQLFLENIIEYPYDLHNTKIVKIADRIIYLDVIKQFFNQIDTSKQNLMDRLFEFSDHSKEIYIQAFGDAGVSDTIPLKLCVYSSMDQSNCDNILIGLKIYNFYDVHQQSSNLDISNSMLTNEIDIIEKLSNEFVKTKKTPHLIMFIQKYDIDIHTSDNYVKFDKTTKKIKQEKKQNGNKINKQIFSIMEWADKGTLKDNWSEGLKIKDHFTIFLFQLLYTLSIIRETYPNFRHQDLHSGNILVSSTNNKDGYFKYTIQTKTYYIPDCGFQIKIWDFDRSTLTQLKYVTNPDETLEFYDIYRILVIFFWEWKNHTYKPNPQSNKYIDLDDDYKLTDYVKFMEKYFGWDELVRHKDRYKKFPLYNKVFNNKNKKPIDILVDETESNGLFYKYLHVRDDTYIIDSYG